MNKNNIEEELFALMELLGVAIPVIIVCLFLYHFIGWLWR